MSARPLVPTPEAAALKPYTVPAACRRGRLRLDFNENLLGPSPRVLERLRRIGPDDLALYPDETAARAAVARRFKVKPPIDLVLTSGVDEAIRLVCDCFVRRDERIVLLEPGYPMYRFYATLAGGRIVSLDYLEGLIFPEEALWREMDAGARLLILGSPNNPTGTPLPPGLASKLARRHPETLVLVDEAYREFASPASYTEPCDLPNLMVARTFSKAYGLAGLRAGVLLGEAGTLSHLARIRSPYAVNSLALLALEAALEDEDYAARYVAEVSAASADLRAGLARLGVASFPSAANFLIARFGARAVAIKEALRRRGVLVRDRGDHPLLRGTLRIGIGTRADVAAFLDALGGVLAEAARASDEATRATEETTR